MFSETSKLFGMLAVNAAFSLLLGSVACTPGGGGGVGTSGEGAVDDGDIDTDGSTSVVALGDLVAIGRGDQAGIAGEEGTDQLVGVSAEGVVRVISPNELLPKSGEAATLSDSNATISVKCVMRVSPFTMVSATTKTGAQPFFGGNLTMLALIDSEGVVKPVLPAAGATPATLQLADAPCGTSIQVTSDGGVFALADDGGTVWSVDPSTAVATPILVAGAGESISNYLATDRLNIFYSAISGSSTVTKRYDVLAGSKTDLAYPNNFIFAPKPLTGGKGFTFIPHENAGGVVLSVTESGTVQRYFVEPLYPTNDLTAWGDSSHMAFGDWIFTGNTALKTSLPGFSGNPFWNSEGRFQGLVDHDEQIYFDGSGLVKVNLQDEVLVSITHHLSLVTAASLPMKVIAVFGPAQGFTDKLVGFATNEGFVEGIETNLFWVEIDPATGALDSSRIFKIQADNIGGSHDPDVIPSFTPYRLNVNDSTTRIVGLGGDPKANLFELTFNETDPANKKAVMGASKGLASNLFHSRALIHGSRLYFTATAYDADPPVPFHSKIFFYDASTDAVSPVSGSAASANDMAFETAGLLPEMNNTTEIKCNGVVSFGLLRIPGNGGPSLLYCSTEFTVRLATFSSFDFDNPEVVFDRGTFVIAPGNPSGDTYGDFGFGDDYGNGDLMQSYALSSGAFVIGLGRPHVHHTVLMRPLEDSSNPTGILNIISHRRLPREGRVEFWDMFHAVIDGEETPTTAPSAASMARWDDDTLFAARLDNTGAPVSGLVDLTSGNSWPLASPHDSEDTGPLEGVTVSAAVRITDEKFLVSGTVSGNSSPAVNIILDNETTEVSRTDSGVIVKELVEIVD